MKSDTGNLLVSLIEGLVCALKTTDIKSTVYIT